MGDRRRGRMRPYRDAAELRLEPGEAREAARDADRAAAVGAERERRHAGRDGGRGAGARSARRLARVPRITRDAVERIVADRLAAELARRGLADQDRAGRV